MAAPSSDRAGVRQTIRALRAAGYTLVSVEHEEDMPVANEREAVEEVMSVDESWLWVRGTDGKLAGVFFVLGNDPEEVICDHHVSLSPVLDPLVAAWWGE